MSEYVIDYLTGSRQHSYGSWDMFNLHIKIDKFGNINIKQQSAKTNIVTLFLINCFNSIIF